MKIPAAPDLCVGLAMLLLLGTVMLASINRREAETYPAPFQGADYERFAYDEITALEGGWEDPSGQSAGEDWVFDLFTPPIIYYHPGQQRFVLTPPDGHLKKALFGLTLESVSYELYRLQYAGHVGEEARYVVEIRDIETRSYFRGRVGDRFPEAAFSIEDFVVERRVVQPEDSRATPYVETVVQLIIRDECSRKTMTLSREPIFEEFPMAIVRDPDGALHRLRVGASISVDGAIFTLVDADPEAGSARFRKDYVSGEASEVRQLGSDPP